MSREYFSILGLAPGRYAPRDVKRRFETLRSHLDESSDRDSDAVRRQRDDLHLAYNALRDPRRQSAHLQALQHGTTEQGALRRFIAAALEDDLLRHSRRAAILDEGRRIGLSDFHTQLLIAEVQFASNIDDAEHDPDGAATAADRDDSPTCGRRPAFRLAAAGIFAAAIFLAVRQWLAL